MNLQMLLLAAPTFTEGTLPGTDTYTLVVGAFDLDTQDVWQRNQDGSLVRDVSGHAVLLAPNALPTPIIGPINYTAPAGETPEQAISVLRTGVREQQVALERARLAQIAAAYMGVLVPVVPQVSSSPLSIVTQQLQIAVAGQPYSAQIVAAGGQPPYAWSAANLPSGVVLAPGGVLSGSVSAPGTFSISVTVTDQNTPTPGAVTLALPLSVALVPLAVATQTLADGHLNQAYSQQLAATGGVGPFTWTATGLPAGLTLSAQGLLAGTPTATGTSAAAVTVTDSGSRTASRTLSLVIAQ